MRNNIRIPIFNREFLFNVYNEIFVDEDIPDCRWIDHQWKPEISGNNIGSLYDTAAEHEVFRLLKFRTCAYCREKMDKINPISGGVAFVCKNCFYWGGRGTRPGGPSNTRGNLGRINFVKNLEEAKLEQVISYLNQNIDRLLGLTPTEAEKLLPEVLKDYLNCEVKAFGGTRDGGIDAMAIRGENEKMLIQIKWRESKNSAEKVSVVREVGGTLLARKIPQGLIISTRQKFSKDAIKESKLISENEIVNIGKLNIELKDFNDLIDMFEISAKTRTENLSSEEIIPEYNEGFDLFGHP